MWVRTMWIQYSNLELNGFGHLTGSVGRAWDFWSQGPELKPLLGVEPFKRKQ